MRDHHVYGDFAEYYDLLMQDAPYDKWMEIFMQIVQQNQMNPHWVADLGCGTGTISIELAKRGYRVFAVDLSEDMLTIAEGKWEGSQQNLIFLQQDIRELCLSCPVDLAVSFCDTFNYLLEEEDLIQAFRAVYQHIKQKGLFIFDMHTPFHLKNRLGNEVFYDLRREISYIWQSTYDEKRCLVEYDITFFAEIEERLYRRFQETHYQRAYPLENVVAWLKQVGFKRVEAYADFTLEKPSETTERVFFVAHKE